MLESPSCLGSWLLLGPGWWVVPRCLSLNSYPSDTDMLVYILCRIEECCHQIQCQFKSSNTALSHSTACVVLGHRSTSIPRSSNLSKVLYCTYCTQRCPCNPQFIPGLLRAPAGSRPRARTASLSALSPNLPRRGSSAPPCSLFALTPSLCLSHMAGAMGGEGPAQCNVVRSCPLINLGSFIRLDF